jgi:Fic family protein
MTNNTKTSNQIYLLIVSLMQLQGEASSGEIVLLTGANKQMVSAKFEKLEKRGYIVFVKKEGYKNFYCLTSKGEKSFEIISASFHEVLLD